MKIERGEIWWVNLDPAVGREIRKRRPCVVLSANEVICQDEVNVRQQRLMERRTKTADFRGLKTLEDFDWSFNPAVHRKEIFDLATGHFIRQAKDVLFLGPPGVGKTLDFRRKSAILTA